jgi:DNA-binding FadR family transcriptional regulator
MSFIPHPLAPTQGRTAADPTGTVAQALVSLLLAQGVRAGEKIPAERVLTEELGVSRGALREAISQLSFVGLLESRHGSGTYFRGADAARMSDVMAWFSAFNGTDVAQVVDARWTIEVTVTRLAASRRSMSDLRDLRSCLGDMRTAGTREEFVASDLAFHRIVARSCSNTVLARLHAEIEVIAEHWVPPSATRTRPRPNAPCTSTWPAPSAGSRSPWTRTPRHSSARPHAPSCWTTASRPTWTRSDRVPTPSRRTHD